VLRLRIRSGGIRVSAGLLLLLVAVAATLAPGVARVAGRSDGCATPGLRTTLISVALLVASLVRLLVVVFLEVPFLAVVPVMRMVRLTFVHALLVSFVFRIILVMVLEKWSPSGLCRAPRNTNACR
jgi:hypothetical protein